MAATNPSQTRANAYNFHSLGGLQPHCVAIRLMFVYPGSAIIGNLPLDLGRLEGSLPDFSMTAAINSGRIGLPAAELRFEIAALTTGATKTELRLAFEPGLHAPFAPVENHYNLQEFSAAFQGRGGVAHATNVDHPDLENEQDPAKRKRILKMKLITHAVMPYPDVFALNAVLTDNRTPQAARDFIQMLLRAQQVEMIWYCLVSDNVQRTMQADILNPFQSILQQRLPPLYQYEPFQRILALDMEPYEKFRNHMYCGVEQNSATGFSTPHHALLDMQARSMVSIVAKAHMVGHIREHQALKWIILQLTRGHQKMRLVKSKSPVLSNVTRSISQPADATTALKDPHMYIGYMNAAPRVSQDIETPPAGTRFEVVWQRKVAERAFGIVLDVSPLTLRDKNAAFVIALFKLPKTVKDRAALSIADAKIENVKFVSVRNLLGPQTQLDALHRLASNHSRERLIHSLQMISTYRENIFKFTTRDIRGNPAVWDRALTEMSKHQLQGRALPPGANNFLTRGVTDIDEHIELLRTPAFGSRIDGCLALVWQFLATDRRVILISDFVESRTDLSARMWKMRGLAKDAPEFGKLWFNKLLLAYTCTEMAHEAQWRNDNQNRPAIDLSSRFLDDLPSHGCLTEEPDVLSPNSTSSRSQSITIPPGMSMGSAISSLLSRPQTPAQKRNEYLTNRAEEIDGAAGGPTTSNTHTTLARRNDLELEVLRSAHLLITDSTTAISTKVRTSMPHAILMYLDTQAVAWSTVAATVACYPKAAAVLICGNSADARFPLRWYGMKTNEAWRTTVHGAWGTFVRAGNAPVDLA